MPVTPKGNAKALANAPSELPPPDEVDFDLELLRV
jgi:hypothetical protein